MNEKKRREVLNRLTDHRRWYAINNKAGPVATVRIYDEIGFFGVTAENFVAEIDQISAPEMVVAINCPGGDVFDGIAIYNALRTHPAKVTTRVDSLAASAASLIVQAGDSRVMLSSSQMMIHEAWGISVGTAKDMREFAGLLDKQSDILASVYAARSGKDVGEFRTLMTDETWLTDKEAVEQGLADEVIEPSSAAKIAPAALARKTLNDELADANDVLSQTLKSAERVAAQRAEHGDRLSQANTSSLEELARNAERVKTVLEPSADSGRSEDPPEADSGRSEEVPDEELLRLRAKLEALSN